LQRGGRHGSKPPGGDKSRRKKIRRVSRPHPVRFAGGGTAPGTSVIIKAKSKSHDQRSWLGAARFEISSQFKGIVDRCPTRDTRTHMLFEFETVTFVQLPKKIAGQKRADAAIGTLGISSDPPARFRLGRPPLGEHRFKLIR
jgi:hypothetical protein